MKKVKSLLGLMLSLCLVGSSIFIVHATPSFVPDTETRGWMGGWDEIEGFFMNESTMLRSSTPDSHFGQRQDLVINGTTNWRSHGVTDWSGMFHYTTARMVRTQLFGADIVVECSGRQWGTNRTTATSPWVPFNPNVSSPSARTFWGN